MKLKYVPVVLFLLTLIGCTSAAKESALLGGETLEGAPICLDNQEKIPAFVKKFFNTRDLSTEEGKIDYLLERISRSKLTFIRNKVEYDSASAAKFMRWKLDRWKKKGAKIETAQGFISFISSGSKTSGQPYTIILQDGSRHNLQTVLQNELNALLYCLQQYASEEKIEASLGSSTNPKNEPNKNVV